MRYMENKLDVLTKKLYEEGVDKANQEAENNRSSKGKSSKIDCRGWGTGKGNKSRSSNRSRKYEKKAESEMTLSARQAITALKQSITSWYPVKWQEISLRQVLKTKHSCRKWLSLFWKMGRSFRKPEPGIAFVWGRERKFQQFVATKYKELLDKGLEIKVGDHTDAFVIQPKDGGYQVAFSEKLFETFFNQYMRSFTKSLLYK